MFSPKGQKALALLALNTAVSACGNDAVYRNAYQVLGNAFGDQPYPIERSAVDQSPYASISAQINKNPKAFIVLATIEEKGNTWLAADYKSLITKRGRLLKTTGFDNNLAELLMDGRFDDYFEEDRLNKPYELGYTFMEPKPAVYALKCEMTKVGDETIEILDRSYDLVKYAEKCKDPRFWYFTNEYWIDPSNHHVWKSKQHFHPEYDPVDIEVLKAVNINLQR